MKRIQESLMLEPENPRAEEQYKRVERHDQDTFSVEILLKNDVMAFAKWRCGLTPGVEPVEYLNDFIVQQLLHEMVRYERPIGASGPYIKTPEQDDYFDPNYDPTVDFEDDLPF